MFFFIILFGAARTMECWILRRERRRSVVRDHLLSLGKTLLWVVTIGVYFFLFHRTYGDWFQRPLILQGEINSLEQAPDQRHYDLGVVDVHGVSEVFSIDEAAFQVLRSGDQVELTVLPLQKRVSKCRVIARIE
jgi:hypothetical protein